MNYTVVVPHTETGLRDETRHYILNTEPDCAFVVTPARQPWSYIDRLRALWRFPYEFVICEQDVVPPPGAINRLAHCQHDWCTHPHWLGERYSADTMGLTRWSLALREAYPFLLDILCTPQDPRYWVRRGWTAIPRDCGVGVLNSSGRRATLTHGAPIGATTDYARDRPSSRSTFGLDTDLSRALRNLGVHTHVHPNTTVHLHDYVANPPGSRRDWPDTPYEELDWPT